MKRFLLLTISIIAIATSSQGQITKGTILLGGDMGLSSYKNDHDTAYDKSTGFFLSPSIGFAIKNNNILGIRLSYGQSTVTTDHSKQKGSRYVAGVYYRRYLPIVKGFYGFGQADAAYSYDQSKHSSDNGVKETTTSIGFALFPGVTYAINKRIHLEAALNNLVTLNYMKTTNSVITPTNITEWENNYFDLSTNTSLFSNFTIGFRFLLGK